MNNQNSDQELVNFLKQNCSNIPESAPDLEQKILAAIEGDWGSLVNETQWVKTRLTASPKFYNKLKISSVSKWVLCSAIAAALLVFGSEHRAFNTAQLPEDETAHLEAFLLTNWEGVLHDYRAENMTDRSQTDWLNFPVSDDSELPTNN